MHCKHWTSKYQLVMCMLYSFQSQSQGTPSLVYSLMLMRGINCFNFGVIRIQTFDPEKHTFTSMIFNFYNRWKKWLSHRRSPPWDSIFIKSERNDSRVVCYNYYLLFAKNISSIIWKGMTIFFWRFQVQMSEYFYD